MPLDTFSLGQFAKGDGEHYVVLHQDEIELSNTNPSDKEETGSTNEESVTGKDTSDLEIESREEIADTIS